MISPVHNTSVLLVGIWTQIGLFKATSLQTSPWWDSGKLWFREKLSLAKSMILLPRSPTVIKWVNDWIKLLMVGWVRWPLRSCQVSISENQEFYQSNKNAALHWADLRENWKVSKMFPFCLSFHFSVLSPHFQHSCQAVITLKASLRFCVPQRKAIWLMNSEYGRERSRLMALSSTAGCVIWEFVI